MDTNNVLQKDYRVSMVVAASLNNVIGLRGNLPWHLPKDLAFFKNITWGLPVIMGRKSFDSLKRRPLKGRMNIVLTNNPGQLNQEGIFIANNIESAIQLALDYDYKEIMVIGGGNVYAQALHLTDKVYLTRIDATLDGDAFFPVLDPNEWKLVFEEKHGIDKDHSFSFAFQEFVRVF